MLDNVKKELQDFADRYGLQSQLSATQIVACANKLLPGNAEAISLRAGVLSIEIEDNVDRYTIEVKKQSILKKINQEIAPIRVTSFKFKLKTSSSLVHTSRHQEQGSK